MHVDVMLGLLVRWRGEVRITSAGALLRLVADAHGRREWPALAQRLVAATAGLRGAASDGWGRDDARGTEAAVIASWEALVAACD